MSILLEKKIYACGTVRANWQNWPVAFKKRNSLELKQGESKVLQAGRIIATVWHDKRDVLLISTNSNPFQEDEIERVGKQNNRE